MKTPALYGPLAAWWPLLSAPQDYEEEAAFYAQALLGAGTLPAQTLLELGSGGGNNASHLKRRFTMTLVDASAGMLEVSRALNPDCEHVHGDMRTVRLGREFDRVFVHDAIAYMTTGRDLRRAMETAFVHCRAGGAALLAPDHVRETYVPATSRGGHDGEGRALRYLEWSQPADPRATTVVVEYVYLLRDAGGAVSVHHDRHVEGLSPRATWLRLLAEVGFRQRALVFDHSELAPGSYELFVCEKP